MDTSRVWILAGLCSNYRYSNTDSSVFYGEKALNLARQIKFLRGEANTLNRLSQTFLVIGDLPRALELQYSALKISEDNNFQLEKAACLRRIGSVYTELKNYNKAIGLFLTALKIDSVIKNKGGVAIDYDNLGMVYQYMNNADSALYYNRKAFNELNNYKDMATELYRVRGDIEAMNGYNNSAVNFYQQGIQLGLKSNDYRNNSFTYSNLAALYVQMNQPDSGIYYALKGVESGQKSSFKKGILLSANLLAQLYDSANPSKSLYYYKIAAVVKESLFGAGNIQTIQALVAKEEARQKEIEQAETTYQNKLKQYGLAGGLGVLCIIALILYRNNLQKQKANKVLQTTLDHLKSAQAQLIQSEKMASLGQLTAGIAHEIQNPLNFVNNFSDVNTELIEELKSEIPIAIGTNVRSEIVDELLNDISENEKKINHHGKRADAIVKGMLQHSRSGTGQKELTDINALADEYLRLSYQGLRAKNSAFNATMNTDFDNTGGKINIIPQDIGRVLLNLYNNAFYAVNEKNKSLIPKGELTTPTTYEPAVIVSTKKIGNKVQVSVKDNGNGIPQNIVDKIFQPFFTTKPTGQGTGLGLSLAYDIVKAHGGEINVNTKEGEGSEFIIQLQTK
ncbi:MAG: ATP-binding protein [Bacteroidota bacterium]